MDFSWWICLSGKGLWRYTKWECGTFCIGYCCAAAQTNSAKRVPVTRSLKALSMRSIQVRRLLAREVGGRKPQVPHCLVRCMRFCLSKLRQGLALGLYRRLKTCGWFFCLSAGSSKCLSRHRAGRSGPWTLRGQVAFAGRCLGRN